MPYPFVFNDQLRNGQNPEANLYSSIYQESMELFGWDVLYLKKSYYNEVSALGEFQTKIIETNPQYLRMFITQVEGFERSNLYSKFGFFPNDYFDAYITKQQLDNYNITLQAGDLIYVPITSKLFELVSYSSRDDKTGMFFFQGSNPGYHLSCRLYYPENQQVAPDLTPNLNSNLQDSLVTPTVTEEDALIDIQNIENLLNINNTETTNNNLNNQNNSINIVDDNETDLLG